MFRILAALTTASFLFAVPAQAQQTSRLDDIVKRGTLRVGMTGDYLPFTSLDNATSKFRGFDVDMAEALGKALGVKVEYVQTAWPQLMKDFEADNFDIAMGGISIHARPAEKRDVLHPDHARRQDADSTLLRQG
jgi:cyclohexadienyl dehydratase